MVRFKKEFNPAKPINAEALANAIRWKTLAVENLRSSRSPENSDLARAEAELKEYRRVADSLLVRPRDVEEYEVLLMSAY